MTRDWDLYDTRHVVYRPARLTPEALKAGYDWAYREFYRWCVDRAGRLCRTARVKHQAKHFVYAAGWKKFEPLWDVGDSRPAAAPHDAAARGGALKADQRGAGAPTPCLRRSDPR